jgi:hypothetical protein
MTRDNSTHDLCNLWQNQPQAAFHMPPEAIHKCMKRFNRRLLRRDLIIYIICLGETIWFSYCFFAVPGWIPKLGSFLIVVAMVYLACQIGLDRHSRKVSRNQADASGNINSLDFYRMELARQRDFHRGVWFWSRLAVLLPGMLVFSIGAMVVFPKSAIGFVLTFVTLVLVAIAIQINRRMSASYQRQIDALDSLSQSRG